MWAEGKSPCPLTYPSKIRDPITELQKLKVRVKAGFSPLLTSSTPSLLRFLWKLFWLCVYLYKNSPAFMSFLWVTPICFNDLKTMPTSWRRCDIFRHYSNFPSVKAVTWILIRQYCVAGWPSILCFSFFLHVFLYSYSPGGAVRSSSLLYRTRRFTENL